MKNVEESSPRSLEKNWSTAYVIRDKKARLEKYWKLTKIFKNLFRIWLKDSSQKSNECRTWQPQKQFTFPNPAWVFWHTIPQNMKWEGSIVQNPLWHPLMKHSDLFHKKIVQKKSVFVWNNDFISRFPFIHLKLLYSSISCEK